MIVQPNYSRDIENCNRLSPSPRDASEMLENVQTTNIPLFKIHTTVWSLLFRHTHSLRMKPKNSKKKLPKIFANEIAHSQCTDWWLWPWIEIWKGEKAKRQRNGSNIFFLFSLHVFWWYAAQQQRRLRCGGSHALNYLNVYENIKKKEKKKSLFGPAQFSRECIYRTRMYRTFSAYSHANIRGIWWSETKWWNICWPLAQRAQCIIRVCASGMVSDSWQSLFVLPEMCFYFCRMKSTHTYLQFTWFTRVLSLRVSYTRESLPGWRKQHSVYHIIDAQEWKWDADDIRILPIYLLHAEISMPFDFNHWFTVWTEKRTKQKVKIKYKIWNINVGDTRRAEQSGAAVKLMHSGK